MKRAFLFISMALGMVLTVNAKEEKQEFKPSGKAFGKIFWNYHLELTEGSEQLNAFEIQRSYFGYKYSFSKDISAKVTLDGSHDGSVFRVFLKNAQIDWKVLPHIKLSAGLIGLKQFDTQEKFWGYRYIEKSFMDKYGLGTSADLGINAEFKLMDGLKANVFLVNGEGYKKLQDEAGNMKAGANLIFEPMDGLILKGHYDMYGGRMYDDITGEYVDTASIHTLAFFAGYKTEKFRIGAEYNMQLNGDKYASIAEDLNLSGIALYGTYIINKNFEMFGTFYNLTSNTLDGMTDPWHISGDGSYLIAGVQYSPVKGVKTALNFKSTMPAADGVNSSSLIYLNCEFAF